MTRVFITPDSKELAEAGVLEEGAVLPEDLECGELLPEQRINESFPEEDFKALWEDLQSRPTEEVLEQIAEQFGDAPGRQREVLTTWMAQELGYSRVWRRRSTLAQEPLWDLLSSEKFSELSERGEEALAMIGRSVMPSRTYLHPSAALATLVLWRHSENEELREEARQRLDNHALPDEPEWLFEVVGVLLSDQPLVEDTHSRSLADLVELTLSHSYWEVAALLSALTLVHKYGRWYHSAVVSNLIRACDVASQQYPQESARWLHYMADAAMGGKLSFSWLERPFQACIRLSIDDLAREEKLRAYVAQRPFDADHRRLEQLFEAQLDEVQKGDEGEALQKILTEVRETVPHHPTRALRLLELVVMRARGRRVGSRLQRMRHALGQMASEEELDELDQWLIGLYIRNLTLESHAAELVRRAGERVDWEKNPFANRVDFEMYAVVSDYERAFEQLTCKFEGVTLEHADKYAAARVKFFVQKRLDPSRLHRMVQKVFTPFEWLGSGLTEIGFVSAAIERGMELFERRISRQNLTEDVVEHFRQAGVPVESFEDIEGLPVDRVETVLKSRRQKRVLLGAVAGGISGGLAPFSWGVLSLADIPILLSVSADISSRFCWYFGFDPREYPELPLEILAVALGGTRPAAIEPMLVRQNLNEYVTRKSLVVGAVAHGGITQLTGRGLARSVERQAGAKAASKVGELARRAVSLNLQRRAVKAAPSRTLPVVGALLGAALNAALLYDISEAAQAVLTDRFLERKYPEWARHIAPAIGSEKPDQHLEQQE